MENDSVTVSSGERTHYERNAIWIGTRRAASADDLPEGVTIAFHARSVGNTVRLPESGKLQNVVVDLRSALDCEVSIGSIRVNFGGLRISFVANNGRYSTGVAVTVGDDCVLNGSTHVIGPLTPGLAVRIGTGCLFASGISVRGSSHHGLWDMTTGELLNPETGIEIGNRVWLGDQVLVLNKARIPDGSVVAARSVVNKSFSDSHLLLAGIPAVVRRRNVEWTNTFPVDNGTRDARE